MAATLVQHLGTGRRKTAVARVFLRPGKGEITVNGRTFEHLFPDRVLARAGAAAAAGDRNGGQVRYSDSGQRRRRRRPGRRGAAGHRPRAGRVQRRSCGQRLKKLGFLTRDPRAARAQEVRPEGRAQALPVLEALAFAAECCGRAFESARIRSFGRVSPGATNSALGRVRETGFNHKSDKEAVLPSISMKELLEAGVHFGHQTKRWNPKMKEYIFGERNGIYIIDLQKTLKLFKDAMRYVGEMAAQGKTVLFVGTKRQAQEAIAEEATRCQMYYVNQRWLGGLLTNMTTVQKSIKRLKELDAMADRRRLRRRVPRRKSSGWSASASTWTRTWRASRT